MWQNHRKLDENRWGIGMGRRCLIGTKIKWICYPVYGKRYFLVWRTDIPGEQTYMHSSVDGNLTNLWNSYILIAKATWDFSSRVFVGSRRCLLLLLFLLFWTRSIFFLFLFHELLSCFMSCFNFPCFYLQFFLVLYGDILWLYFSALVPGDLLLTGLMLY